MANYLSNLLIDLHLELTATDDENINDVRNYIQTVITYLASISENNDLRQAINENDKIPETVRGDYMTAAEAFIQQGIEKGIVQGIEKGILKTAINALKKGFSIETVADLTELDTTKVEQLQRELESKK